MRDYTVLDLEMIGLSAKTDKIIEIGAIKVRDGRVTDAYGTLVNSGQPVPERPPLAERIRTALHQFDLALEDKGEHIACLEARKHLAWYLRGVAHSGYYKEQISHLATAEEVRAVAKAIQRDLR